MIDAMKKKNTMESPLNTQKPGPDAGPKAPTGLPDFTPKDPLGFLPKGGKKE